MENVNQPIIVPWDFSPVADNAFLHAMNYSKTINAGILLLHIASDEKELPEKEAKMKEAVEKLGKEHGITPGYKVHIGSIFTAIDEVAIETNAEMIIMGTHGMKGAQKLFGSRAVKVVVSSRTPFMIVQDKPKDNKIEKILLPIDFKKENKEKANWILQISKKFDAKVTIFKSHPKDSGFKKKLASNLKYIESFLKNNDLDYDVVASKGEHAFKEEVVNYAKENDYDLILIMATRDIKLMDYLFGAPEQFIIANEHNLPVMCINPRPMKIAGGFRATGGA